MNNTNKSSKEYELLSSDAELYKQQLRLKTQQYGSFKFEDDSWYFEKKHTTATQKERFMVYFSDVSTEFKDLLKYYVLMQRIAPQTLATYVSNVNRFLNFFRSHFPDMSLTKVNRKIIGFYEREIRENIELTEHQRHSRYKAIIHFFKNMSGFPGVPEQTPVKKRNPFPMDRDKNNDMYIPTEVVKKFDKIMLDESCPIPDVLRLAYWLQRSFPNRISQVTSVSYNCLKPLYSAYVISFVHTKQSGGYVIAETHTVPVLNTGHGRYIIELIKKVQDQRKELIKKFPVAKKSEDFLLLLSGTRIELKNGKLVIQTNIDKYKLYEKYLELQERFPKDSKRKLAEKMQQEGYDIKDDNLERWRYFGFRADTTLKVITGARFNSYLNKIATLCKITDEKGRIYKIKSHQFRHNATTDRLYIGGYTMDQAMVVRNDKGESMPMVYAHQQKEMHKKMWMESTDLKSPSDAPVEFKGQIFDLDDEKTITRLTKNPRMYLTWEANSKKGVGLCSYISNCNPKGTSIHFECYECDWFVPKAEYYEDYKREHGYWEDVMNSTANQPKRAATFENAVRNVNCLERIIRICEKGIEKYKKEIEMKVLAGELE
ncbi:integrase [Ectobacillus funiculus]|uniref:integrase n=1 Tax=Ectobacillus funiculus TaxID=137993 RepID=UPI0039792372